MSIIKRILLKSRFKSKVGVAFIVLFLLKIKVEDNCWFNFQWFIELRNDIVSFAIRHKAHWYMRFVGKSQIIIFCNSMNAPSNKRSLKICAKVTGQSLREERSDRKSHRRGQNHCLYCQEAQIQILSCQKNYQRIQKNPNYTSGWGTSEHN